MKLTEAKIASVVYKSTSSNEVSARTIIPVSVPKDFVRAFDVSELSTDDRLTYQKLVEGYKEYIDGLLKTAFSFEDWVEHTTGETIAPKWRSFKLDGIQDA